MISDLALFESKIMNIPTFLILGFQCSLCSSVYINIKLIMFYIILCLIVHLSMSQAISRLCDDKYKDLKKAAKKRSVSADNLTVVRWNPAIIS